MRAFDQQPLLNEEIVEEMRRLARKGQTVPELVRTIQMRLGYPEEAVLPILWYFTAAFSLPLPVVLPLREWFTQRNDDEMNALLLPEITRTQAKWRQNSQTSSEHNGANG